MQNFIVGNVEIKRDGQDYNLFLENEEAAQMAGLSSQAYLWRQKAYEAISILGPPLPECEVNIWRSFLPHTIEESELFSFSESLIPPEIIRKYDEVKDAFDSFQVWFDRGALSEMEYFLVGIRRPKSSEGIWDKAYWMIGRWAYLRQPGLTPQEKKTPISFDTVRHILLERARQKKVGYFKGRYFRGFFRKGFGLMQVLLVMVVWLLLFADSLGILWGGFLEADGFLDRCLASLGFLCTGAVIPVGVAALIYALEKDEEEEYQKTVDLIREQPDVELHT